VEAAPQAFHSPSDVDLCSCRSPRQGRWNRGEVGRYAFAISPRVQRHPWFHGLEADRRFITVVSRLMSNHTRVKSHLNRIKIVAEATPCGCGDDYETVDHILWSCSLYKTE
jgi:hypothetical protein